MKPKPPKSPKLPKGRPIPRQAHYVWPYISGTNWHAPVKKFQLFEKRLTTLLGHHEWHQEFQSMLEMAWNDYQLTPNKLVEIAMNDGIYNKYVKWLKDLNTQWREKIQKYPENDWKNQCNHIRSQIDPKWVERFWFLQHLELVRYIIKERQEKGQDYDHIDLMHELGLWRPAIRVKFNWIPYEANERKALLKSKGPSAFAECWDTVAKDETKPTLPMLNPAFLTLQIPLTPTTVRGFDEMVEAIRGVLRDAMKNCPTHKEAPNLVSIIPPQREFLLNVTNAVLKVDIRRYRMYMKQKLNFRQIAYWEDNNTQKRPLKLSEIPERISGKIKKESAVSESVKRIYEAIYLTRFTGSRRRKLDSKASPADVYHCPDHPDRSCPLTCNHLTKWMRKIEVTLPGATSGSGKEQSTEDKTLDIIYFKRHAQNEDNDNLDMAIEDDLPFFDELNFDS